MIESFSKEQRRYFTLIKSKAKSRDIPFELTMKEIYSLLEKQQYKCALTGVSLMVLGENHTASLDRKDSSKSYIKGNIQWVHKDINQMKWKFCEKEFIELCNLVTEHENEKEQIKR